MLTDVTSFFNGTVPASNSLKEAASSIDMLTEGNTTLIIDATAANVTGTFLYFFI